MTNEQRESALPSNLRALIQEHSAGGFLLIKIGAEGEVQNFLEADDDMSYHAILRKAEIFIKSLKGLDEQVIINSMSYGGDMDYFIDNDENEEDYGEEDPFQ